MEITPNYPRQISTQTGLALARVTAAINLLDEGNTIPFIARYRKEVTNTLDEEQLRIVLTLSRQSFQLRHCFYGFTCSQFDVHIFCKQISISRILLQTISDSSFISNSIAFLAVALSEQQPGVSFTVVDLGQTFEMRNRLVIHFAVHRTHCSIVNVQ
ncbi:MAG: hypothetical protein HUU38_29890 [Anaerolineales bacterium]|nr:hypothetical protein [Anaerolineales bacterium]